MPEVIEKTISDADLASVDPWFWAYWNKIRLQSGEFTLKGHDYQIEPMQSRAKKKVLKKGAQLGFTELEVLATLHGMIHKNYPTGVLYLFPTNDDVSDFSKGRFLPLIQNNPGTIRRYIGDTEASNIKEIGGGFLYLRGARATQKVQELKKEASKLRSVPVDKVVFDEFDLMDEDMISLALERFSHSEVQEETYLSTPTIPDYGIDRLYQQSDQRVWIINCPACHRECCLELDFPECVKFAKDGRAYRACMKCSAELDPSNGDWRPQNQKADFPGWWISQLNSIYVDPGKILTLFENPPNGNVQEVYNSKLGMAYIASQNRLTLQDVYACCGQHAISSRDNGPCAMGIDVGKTLHVVIGKRIFGGKKRIVWMGEVPEFEDLHQIAQRFNVKQAGVDYYPETRKAREFQKSAGYPVYLCYYRDKVKEGERADNSIGVFDLARTEICDQTHFNVTKILYELPRRSPQVDVFASQMTSMAKILEEDARRGTKIYRYRKLGPDHFRHAMNYFEIASRSIEEAVDDPYRKMLEMIGESMNKNYDPLTFGLS